MAAGTATVETLTAEVRVLMVGNRQVTLSVYRQLDCCDLTFMEPFGRVNDGKMEGNWVVGRRHDDGALVRAKYFSASHFLIPFVDDEDVPDPIKVCSVVRGQRRYEVRLRMDGRLLEVPMGRTESCGIEGHTPHQEKRVCPGSMMTPATEAAILKVLAERDAERDTHLRAAELPLIVLAGLR